MTFAFQYGKQISRVASRGHSRLTRMAVTQDHNKPTIDKRSQEEILMCSAEDVMQMRKELNVVKETTESTQEAVVRS